MNKITPVANIDAGVHTLIPLRLLLKSPHNARKAPHSPESIEAKAGSIAAKGILQNLVVEPERERKSRPQDARTNFDRFAGLRRNGIWKHDRLGHCAVGHRPVSSFECCVRFDPRQPSGKKRGAPEASSRPLAPTP